MGNNIFLSCNQYLKEIYIYIYNVIHTNLWINVGLNCYPSRKLLEQET